MSEDLSKSVLIGYKISKSDDGSFEKKEVIVISSLVAEKIYAKFIKILWSIMLDPRFNGWKIFEAYTRALMANGESSPYECCACVGSNSSEYKKNKMLMLGGCSAIWLVLDILQAAKETPNFEGLLDDQSILSLFVSFALCSTKIPHHN